MMGRQDRDQGQLFFEFSLDEMIPTDHLLRPINVFATAVLADLHRRDHGGQQKIKRSGHAAVRPSQLAACFIRILPVKDLRRRLLSPAARRSARTGVAAGDLRPNVVCPARPALGI
jgi:hypothetical protein